MLSEFFKAWASAVAKAMAETSSDTSACKDEDDGEHKCASNPQPATCNPQPATCNPQPVTRNLLTFVRPADAVPQRQILRDCFFAGKE
jgi:hypothetical protein